jgi:hypothetical protein
MTLGEPGAQVTEHGRALAKISGIGKAGTYVFGGEEFKVVVSDLGKDRFLLCSLRPRENIAFTSIVISGGMKKLREVME